MLSYTQVKMVLDKSIHILY